MKKWESPTIEALQLKKTAGDFSQRGNDALIPDCIEKGLDDIFGDSGTCPCCS